MRRKFRDAHSSCGLLHDVPDRLFRDPFAPCFPNPVDLAEQPSLIDSGRSEPSVKLGSHPVRNRNRSNVACLPDQINNGPVLFALLEMIQCQSYGFVPPQPTSKQHCEQGSVPFSLEPLRIGHLPKRLGLLRS